MSSGRKVRSHVLNVFLATALASANLPAFAAETHRFDVPATSVHSAIRAFASQAQVQVLVSGENVNNKSLRVVLGEFSTEEALRILLADSGLEPKYVGERTIALVARAATRVPREASGSLEGRRRMAQADAARTSGPIGAPDSAQSGQSNLALEEVVVSAQKRLERLHDVPAPVSVLNTDMLATNNQVLLRDYASSVPGLNVTPNYVGFQNVTIRGITTGSDIPATSVAIDDVPFGGSYTSGVPDIDPGDLARIEVLRGPQGTLYGASSLGGLVKYVTKDPSTEKYEGRVEAGTSDVAHGNDAGFIVRASANIPVSDTWALRLSGFTRQHPGYIDNSRTRGRDVNEAQSGGVRLSSLWKPSDNFSLKLNALYQRSQLDALHEVVVQPGQGEDKSELEQNYPAGVGGDERRVQAYSATMTYRMGALSLTSLTGYNLDHDLNSLDYTFVFGPLVAASFEGATVAPFYYDLAHKKFSQELRLEGPLGPRIDWMLGGFYTREHEYRPTETRIDAMNGGTLEVLGKYFGFATQNWFKEYAAFGNVTWHVTERVDVQVGARTNRDELDIGEAIITGPYAEEILGGDPNIAAPIGASANAFTYLTTLRYKLSDDLMAYARAASGFRPGNANTVLPGIPPKSDPDKTFNYEVGLKGDFLDRQLSFDVSLFRIRWTDIQLQLRDDNNFPYQGNGSEAISQGIELSATLRPARGLSISTWMSYNVAELATDFPAFSAVSGRDGERLPYSSRWSGQLSAQQDFPLSGQMTGFVGGALTYVGDRLGVFMPRQDAPNQNIPPQRQEYPSYMRLDLNLGIEAGAWKSSLFVNNLTDRRGLLSGGLGYFYPPARIYTTPRTFGVNIARTF